MAGQLINFPLVSAERYGPWHPVIDQIVHDDLACGDLQHGFSRVRVHGADTAAIERLVQYMGRCPFSLERFVNISPDGHVFYRTENADCRPFAYENNDGNAPAGWLAPANAPILARFSPVSPPVFPPPDPSHEIKIPISCYRRRSRFMLNSGF